MKRILIAAGLLLAVALPTACGSRPAQSSVFSTQQVVRVFAKHGIRLQATRDQALWGPVDQRFYTPGDRAPFVTAEVLDPRDPIPYFLKPKDLRLLREMDSRQRWAWRGNVLIGWLQRGKADSTGNKVRAALNSLRYSPTDAARLLRPKLQIHPGESRTVDIAGYPVGTTIACVSGSLVVDEYLSARSVALTSDRNKTREIVLRRTPLAGSRRTYSCHARRVSPADGLHGQRSPTRCDGGPRTVHFAGLTAALPAGWYAVTQKDLLWISNEPQCAVNWPTSLYGVYLELRADSGLGYAPHGKTVRHFARLREVMTHGHVPGAYAAELFSEHHGYWLDIQMGARAVGLHGLARATSILRGVVLPPSITLPHG